MKKVFCVFLTVVLCFGTLSACTKPKKQNSTTTAPATTVETTEITSDDNSGEITDEQAKLTATKFLNYMKNKDVKNILTLLDTYAVNYSAKEKLKKIAAYSFFRDIELTSFQIVDILRFADYYRLTVKLNISKSSSELFPAGTSTWVLDVAISDRINDIQLFKNVNESINIIPNEGQSNVFYFCTSFSELFNSLDTYTDFNKMIPVVKDKDAYNTFCYDVIAFTNVLYGGPMPRTQIVANAKKVLGITLIDFKLYSGYNKKDDTILAGGSDFSTVYCSLFSEHFDSNSKQHTIVIDYYADAAYIFKAKTMKYIVKENSDSSLTLLSTTLLFDSGIEPACSSAY